MNGVVIIDTVLTVVYDSVATAVKYATLSCAVGDITAYGDGYKWTALYNANKDKIGTNPNRLFQGLALTVPR